MPNTAPETQPDEGGDELDGAVDGRMCIVTRESGSADELIRFVAAPDGTVVPDLKRKLPGRGCWVKAERPLVDKAVAKGLFSRALKTKVNADPALGAEIDRLLVEQLAGMMNLARKAGQFVTGASKVDGAIRSGQAIAVFHSADAAADGMRKLDQARKAWHLGMETESEIPAFLLLSTEEMDRLMGQNAFIHACALAGQAGEGVVKRANMLTRYRDGGPNMTKGGKSRIEE